MKDAIVGFHLDPDLRTWSNETRRKVSLFVLGAAAVFLLAGILYFILADAEAAGRYMIVAIVVLVLLAILEAAILATGIAQEEDVGPAWLAAPAATHEEEQAAPDDEPAPAPGTTEIDLKCPQCDQLFTIEDTGERPLEIDCPHCGAHGHVDLPSEEDHDGGAAATGADDQGEDPFGDIDEVTDIEGIGPTYGDKLEARGIHTTQDLWHEDPDEIAEALDVSPKVTKRWRTQAELMAVSGIGPQYAELLARSGVTGIDDLAGRQPGGLVSQVQAKLDTLDVNIQGNQVTEGRARRWINDAREHQGLAPLGEGTSLVNEPLEDDLDEDLPSISLKCPNCATQFDVDDTGERPLRTQCPGCGKKGKLG